MNRKIFLSDLKVGQVARIIKINEENKVIKRHLLDMGLTKETNVKIRKMAPIKDPIDIELRGYELCVCKKYLSKIEVEVIK